MKLTDSLSPYLKKENTNRTNHALPIQKGRNHPISGRTHTMDFGLNLRDMGNTFNFDKNKIKGKNGQKNDHFDKITTMRSFSSHSRERNKSKTFSQNKNTNKNSKHKNSPYKIKESKYISPRTGKNQFLNTTHWYNPNSANPFSLNSFNAFKQIIHNQQNFNPNPNRNQQKLFSKIRRSAINEATSKRPITTGVYQQIINSGRKKKKEPQNSLNLAKLLNNTLCIKPTIKIKLNKNNFFNQANESEPGLKEMIHIPVDPIKINKINNIINRYTTQPQEPCMSLADKTSQKRHSNKPIEQGGTNSRRFSIQQNTHKNKETFESSSLRNSFIDLINQTFSSKYPQQFSLNVSQFSFSTKPGKIQNVEKTNQDNFFIATKLNNDPSINFFGVADGHGQFGHEVSNVIKITLPKFIEENLRNLSPKKSIIKAFEETNKEIYKNVENVQLSGSTCVTILIINQEIYCANTGDSRIILCSFEKNKLKSQQLSRDHKPTEPDEAARIIQKGGRIEPFKDQNGEFLGPLRVWMKEEDLPGLAMTRSMGDSFAAIAGVISVPEIMTFKFMRNDKFIVIASDGVWEFLNNDDVAKIVWPFYLQNNAEGAANTLVQEAYRMWEDLEDIIDDITCLILFLKSK